LVAVDPLVRPRRRSSFFIDTARKELTEFLRQVRNRAEHDLP
jgi:hypothetical protein